MISCKIHTEREKKEMKIKKGQKKLCIIIPKVKIFFYQRKFFDFDMQKIKMLLTKIKMLFVRFATYNIKVP